MTYKAKVIVSSDSHTKHTNAMIIVAPCILIIHTVHSPTDAHLLKF